MLARSGRCDGWFVVHDRGGGVRRLVDRLHECQHIINRGVVCGDVLGLNDMCGDFGSDPGDKLFNIKNTADIGIAAYFGNECIEFRRVRNSTLQKQNEAINIRYQQDFVEVSAVMQTTVGGSNQALCSLWLVLERCDGSQAHVNPRNDDWDVIPADFGTEFAQQCLRQIVATLIKM